MPSPASTYSTLRPASLAAVVVLALVCACGTPASRVSPASSPSAPVTLSVHRVALPTAGAAPTGIVAGSDGAFWVTEEGGDRIARVTAAGAVSEFALPRRGAPGLGITSGPDGALWFTDRGADEVDRLTTTGSLQRFHLPSGSTPLGITAGPLNSLWATQNTTGEVDRIALDGTVAAVAQLGSDAQPFGITAGPDGNLWVGEKAAIARVTPTGTVSTYRLPEPAAGALRIVSGVGGDLWFVEEEAGLVGHITVDGKVTELAALLGQPSGITLGSDKHMWVAEQGAGRVDRVDGDHLTPFVVPTPQSAPEDIVAGAHGTMWFTDFHAGEVAWFSLDMAHSR